MKPVDVKILASDLPRKTVLVLMATYNGGRWIEEQLASILRQNEIDVCIVASDDGSHDETLSILEGVQSSDERVTVHETISPSGSAGKNFRRLITSASSKFDYVAFADQDDIWLPDKLSRAVRELNSSRASGYSSAVQAFGAGHDSVLDQSSSITSSDFLFEGAGQGCTFVMRNDFFSRVQAFCLRNKDAADRFHYHDWMVYVLARAWDLTWVFDPIPSVKYRQHATNELGARVSWPNVKRRLALIESRWYQRQILCACDVYQRAGGSSTCSNELISILRDEPSLRRRIRLTWAAAMYSRRRWSDRLIVCLAALSGRV